MDNSSVIYGNKMPKKVVKKAQKSKAKYVKKYGDDSKKDYKISFKPISTLDYLGADNIVFGEENQKFEKNALIVGNIRMGFGHYRISIAIASCAKALGFKPYWLDLASFDATGSKLIREQNDMYSLASRISQKSKLFNHFVWEPLNCEGFKKISYNAKDQANSELLAPIYKNIDKEIPYVATHVWPAQGAVHGGMKHVVNAVPDNWPMGLHLAEGSVMTVQTPFAYQGYKTLDGFDKKPLKGMKDEQLKLVGCYVDHELLVDLEKDNEARRDRLKNNKPLRFLMTVGGAGAGFDQYLAMVKHLIPYIKEKKVALFINFGDHLTVYKKLLQKVPELKCKEYFNKYEDLKKLRDDLLKEEAEGIYAIYNKDIFEAVYSTNLLMRTSDLLITKPSELVFYPIPKLFMRHIGGHEVYGGIFGREYGDATPECGDKKSINAMLDYLINDHDLLTQMTRRIDELKKAGHYDGGYKAVKLAAGIKD
ncbi:MAG: hypothetical protein K5906_03890 [Bacilli bacterium]|nr:hypothetical protein [Bacilli bacterium]